MAILGPRTPAADRLETIARFLGFISESITRAAEQARDVLHTPALHGQEPGRPDDI